MFTIFFKSRHVYILDIEIETSCGEWHEDRVILVYYQERTRHLAKIISSLESCACKNLIAPKGICVGPRCPVVKQTNNMVTMYLEEF